MTLATACHRAAPTLYSAPDCGRTGLATRSYPVGDTPRRRPPPAVFFVYENSVGRGAVGVRTGDHCGPSCRCTPPRPWPDPARARCHVSQFRRVRGRQTASCCTGAVRDTPEKWELNDGREGVGNGRGRPSCFLVTKQGGHERGCLAIPLHPLVCYPLSINAGQPETCSQQTRSRVHVRATIGYGAHCLRRKGRGG